MCFLWVSKGGIDICVLDMEFGLDWMLHSANCLSVFVTFVNSQKKPSGTTPLPLAPLHPSPDTLLHPA